MPDPLNGHNIKKAEPFGKGSAFLFLSKWLTMDFELKVC
jgi:hypothetical protein